MQICWQDQAIVQLPIIMNKDIEVRPQPEQDDFSVQRLKEFRQTYTMAKIFHELRKNANYPCDLETGRVLFDSHSNPESMPSVFSSKEEIAEHDARETDIVNEGSTWFRILPNGDIEIKHENYRYDLNHVIPTVDIDDAADAINAMTCAVRDRREEEEEDPMGTNADQAAASGKMLLGRNEEFIVLHRVGDEESAQVWGFSEKFDYDGTLIERTETEPTNHHPDSKACYDAISHYRFNMFSELRYTLNKAVESEAPEHYQAFFTPEVKQQILKFALEEARQNALNGKERKIEEDVRIYGKAERIGMTLYPQVEYSVSSTNKEPNGKIRIEYAHVLADLQETMIGNDLEAPDSLPALGRMSERFQYSDEIRDAVKAWEEARRDLVGEPSFKQEALAQLSKLKEQMASNEGSAHGQIRVVMLDPLTGEYQYYFFRRTYLEEDDEPNVEVETHFGDNQNPNPDELAMLMSFSF